MEPSVITDGEVDAVGGALKGDAAGLQWSRR